MIAVYCTSMIEILHRDFRLFGMATFSIPLCHIIICVGKKGLS